MDEKNAYADSTIKGTQKRLKHMQRNCILDNPEHVKGFITTNQCSNTYKNSLAEAYNHLCRANNITWNNLFSQAHNR